LKFTVGEDLISVRTRGKRFVTIFVSSFSVDEKRNFRCFGCGKIICQYEGDVIAGIDGGDKPESKASIEVLCTRCRIMYRFIS
jgi:phage FluMu protein Com